MRYMFGSRELQHLYVNTTFQVERNGDVAYFTFSSTIVKAIYAVWTVVLFHDVVRTMAHLVFSLLRGLGPR